MRTHILFFISLALIQVNLHSQSASTYLDIEKLSSLSRGDGSPVKMKDIQYVLLETKEECLIGEITEIRYSNGNFFINDLNTTQSILVFNHNGDFLYKINKPGNGPGEYTTPGSFDVDEFGNVYIMGLGSRKLIKYSNNGARFEEFGIDYMVTEFMVLGKDKILVNCPFTGGNSQVGIAILDLKNKSITELTPFRKPYDDMQTMHFGVNSFFRSGNKILFNPHYSNIVYEIEKEKAWKYLHFNENLIPPAEIILNLNPRNPESVRNLVSTGRYVVDISSAFENNSFITLTILRGTSNIIFISKKTGSIICTSKLEDKLYIGANEILGVTEESFISKIPPRLILSKEWTEKVRSGNLDPETKKKLLNITELSNPILVLFKLEDF